MFNQSVAGTLHGPHPAKPAQDPAHQRRFAGAQLPRQRDDHPAAQPGRKRRTRARGGLGVRKIPAERFYNVRFLMLRASVSPMSIAASSLAPDLAQLSRDLRAWARELGFAEIGIADTGLAAEETRLRSEEHTSELQSRGHLVCRLLLEKKKPTLSHIMVLKNKRLIMID